MPTESQLHEICELVSQLFKNRNIEYILFDELQDYYLNLETVPNLNIFISQSKNQQLIDACSTLPTSLVAKYSSSTAIDLSPKINYIFSEDPIASSFIIKFLTSFLSQTNCRKILVMDIKNPSLFKNDFLSSARKIGMAILDLQENFNYYPNHHTGIFCLNIKSGANKVLDQLPSLSKVINENFLRYDLGLKGIYGKTHLNYKSNQLKDLVYKNPSLAQSLLLESNNMKTIEVKPSTPYLSSISKLNFNEDSPYGQKQSIGIWDSSDKELGVDDLLLFDKKLSSQKLGKGIVILKTDILEHDLYHKYNYKQCIHPISFKTKEDLAIEINNFNDLESKNHKLEVPKSVEPNCFILFIDPYNVGLLDLELN